MTILIFALLASILAMGTPGHIGLTPEGAFEAGLMDREPPPCRELSRGERRELGIEPKGKAATYSIDGLFVCERRIFDYGDREGYVEFVAEHAARKATAVARRVAVLVDTSPVLAERVWLVEATSPNPRLAAYVTRVFRHALATTLGARRVGRQGSPEAARLEIETFAVQDDDILFRTTVRVTTAGATSTWAL